MDDNKLKTRLGTGIINSPKCFTDVRIESSKEFRWLCTMRKELGGKILNLGAKFQLHATMEASEISVSYFADEVISLKKELGYKKVSIELNEEGLMIAGNKKAKSCPLNQTKLQNGKQTKFTPMKKQEVVNPKFRGSRINSLCQEKLMSFEAKSRVDCFELVYDNTREGTSRRYGKSSPNGQNRLKFNHVGFGCNFSTN